MLPSGSIFASLMKRTPNRSSIFLVTVQLVMLLFFLLGTAGVAVEAQLGLVDRAIPQPNETPENRGGMESDQLPSSAEMTQLTPMLLPADQSVGKGKQHERTAEAPVALTCPGLSAPTAIPLLAHISTASASRFRLLGQKPSGTA